MFFCSSDDLLDTFSTILTEVAALLLNRKDTSKLFSSKNNCYAEHFAKTLKVQ